jgi:nitronate monooxygenase
VSSVDAGIFRHLRLPLIAAPMTGVSGFDLVAAATAAGIAASFPAHNAGPPEVLDRWLERLELRGSAAAGPVIPNLIVHRSNVHLGEHLAVVTRHAVPAVITSVGSPRDVVGPLHDAGILVFADVASMRHAERAIASGADGLVLLSAGAGGQTGWANPLVFGRAVRAIWAGPLILAGGVVDGQSLLAALVAGYDLAYMGTPFIATTESAAGPEYKDAVVAASMDDIELTSALTGLPSSMIRLADPAPPVPAAATSGFDAAMFERVDSGDRPQRFSAGHSVAAVDTIVDVAALVDRLAQEFHAAADRVTQRWW